LIQLKTLETSNLGEMLWQIICVICGGEATAVSQRQSTRPPPFVTARAACAHSAHDRQERTARTREI